MTSEVTSDLKIQLSDLDYLCFHVSLASKCHYFKNVLEEAECDPLTCVASPQVKILKILQTSFKNGPLDDGCMDGWGQNGRPPRPPRPSYEGG